MHSRAPTALHLQVYNKIDVSQHDLPVQWMHDFNAFQKALDSDDSYAGSLSRSLSLVLDDFYQNLSTVGVSSVTGEGMGGLFEVRTGTLRRSGMYRMQAAEHSWRQLPSEYQVLQRLPRCALLQHFSVRVMTRLQKPLLRQSRGAHLCLKAASSAHRGALLHLLTI